MLRLLLNFIAAGFTLYSAFCVQIIFADEGNVVITEIMYDGKGSDEDQEWVEIFNSKSEQVTIATGAGGGSWRFFDGSNHTFNLFQGSATINPGEYAILAEDPQTFLSNYPAFQGTIFKVALSLGNDSEVLKISADRGKTYFGEVSYGKTLGGAGNGKTLERIDTGWQQSHVTGGTPGLKASEPQPPSVYSNLVAINEIYPNPREGEKEFIELTNLDSKTVDLSDWSLDDKIVGGSKPHTLPKNTLITSGGYLVLVRAIALNNDGDEVNLTAPDGKVKSSYVYSSSTKGRAWAKNPTGAFVLTRKPTPGAANEFSQTFYSKDLVINEIAADPPTGNGDEFVELRNLSSAPIDITDWQLDDGEGGSKPFVIPENTIVPALGYYIFYNSTTSVKLNNDGDRVRLMWDDGAMVSEVSYGKAEENQAFARRDEGGFSWTIKPTPGSPNEFPAAAAAASPTAHPVSPNDTEPIIEATSEIFQEPEVSKILAGDKIPSVESEALPDQVPKNQKPLSPIYQKENKAVKIPYQTVSASGALGFLGLIHQWRMRKGKPNEKPVKSLFIDTVGSTAKVCLNDECLKWPAYGNVDKLLHQLNGLLRKNKTSLDQVLKIFVNVGPGSFTGTRVGVAAANALAWALKIPVNDQRLTTAYYDAGGEKSTKTLPRRTKPVLPKTPRG